MAYDPRWDPRFADADDDDEPPERGRPRSVSELSPMRSVSPRRAAARLLKTLNADPATDVTPNLGAHSTSHPGVAFESGGGFTARTRVARELSSEELDADHERRLASWATHGSRGSAPTRPASKSVVEAEGDLEYHPPGGIHSNYNPHLDEGVGGSYLRVKTRAPALSESRYGRHGPFANDRTFDDRPLRRNEHGTPGPAELSSPVLSTSPPPSPRTARALTARLYAEPQQTLAELASGRSYPEVARTAPPPASASRLAPMGHGGGGKLSSPQLPPRGRGKPPE
ncbi:MAG TPA: hypothetical protein VFW00_06240 [Rhodocyclaceae bacterium]|nr:hypothetical protein [Rhodocyclaceae bacterium]